MSRTITFGTNISPYMVKGISASGMKLGLDVCSKNLNSNSKSKNVKITYKRSEVCSSGSAICSSGSAVYSSGDENQATKAINIPFSVTFMGIYINQ